MPIELYFSLYKEWDSKWSISHSGTLVEKVMKFLSRDCKDFRRAWLSVWD